MSGKNFEYLKEAYKISQSILPIILSLIKPLYMFVFSVKGPEPLCSKSWRTRIKVEKLCNAFRSPVFAACRKKVEAESFFKYVKLHSSFTLLSNCNNISIVPVCHFPRKSPLTKTTTQHQVCKVFPNNIFIPNFLFVLRSCRLDMCECPPGRKCHCEVLTAYARACERAGVLIPDWREATGCAHKNSWQRAFLPGMM